MKPKIAVAVALLACVCGLSASAAAQLVPTLAGNLPAYVQRGQSRTITLNGQNLASVSGVVVAAPSGLQAELVKPTPPSETQLALKLTAAPDAEPGDREVRLVGPAGVSSPMIVAVGAWPLVELKAPAAAGPEAHAIRPLPAVMVGRVSGGRESDEFDFHATKGQQLLFDAAISRLGSTLEPVLVIRDAAGKELPTVAELHGGDPLLILDVPADGDYRMEIRDLRFRGGGNFEYRIEAGALPYVEAVFPMSAPRGKVVELKAIGHNLAGGEKIAVDLTQAAAGRMLVRARTAQWVSNAVPLEVTDADSTSGAGDHHTAAGAAPIAFPADVSGRLDRPGNEDFYKFHLAQKQAISVDVVARKLGSPLDALLSLRNAAGVIETSNGTGGADSRINRELEPGDYLLSVRDLTFDGGGNFNYRLQLRPATAANVSADFGVRFLPDAPRVRRGSSAPIWCEVDRTGGFAGEVTVTLEGLPPGVVCQNATISPVTSGLFTVSAGADAALGAYPIRLKATAVANGQPVVRYAEPELNGRGMQQAYLSVLEAAPFRIEPLTLTPARVQQFREEMAAIQAKNAQPDAGLDAQQAEWEKKIVAAPAWIVLEAQTLVSSAGATLTKQPDGSVLAGGAVPAKDTYTFTARTSLKGITAIRLEALSDPALPAQGPGRAPNGNFVLDEFKVTAQSGPAPAQPVVLKNAVADFAQDGFPIGNVIDNNPATGWAISSQFGKDHVATFLTAAPPAAADAETVLTFELQQQSQYAQHVIGRFRISVTSADPSALPHEGVPSAILGVLKVPAANRTPEQKVQLATYFRANNPATLASRGRLDALVKLLGPYDELQKVEQQLNAATPQVADEQAKWEQTPPAQAAPVPANVIAIVKTPTANRTDEQRGVLAAYFRTVAPSLQPLRDKASQLRSQVASGSPISGRNRAASISVVITRNPDFNGDIAVTLEGFSAGRDPVTRLPMPLARNLKVVPLVINGAASMSLLSFTPEGGSELGTRQVVLKGEAKIGANAVTQYSEAFPLTVNEK